MKKKSITAQEMGMLSAKSRKETMGKIAFKKHMREIGSKGGINKAKNKAGVIHNNHLTP